MVEYEKKIKTHVKKKIARKKRNTMQTKYFMGRKHIKRDTSAFSTAFCPRQSQELVDKIIVAIIHSQFYFKLR